MKLRVCNFIIALTAAYLPLVSNHVLADENNNQPDAAFLEFLAGMTEVEGEITDPLDMLELADSDVGDESNNNEIEKNIHQIESQILKNETVTPNKDNSTENEMNIDKKQLSVIIKLHESLAEESQL